MDAVGRRAHTTSIVNQTEPPGPAADFAVVDAIICEPAKRSRAMGVVAGRFEDSTAGPDLSGISRDPTPHLPLLPQNPLQDITAQILVLRQLREMIVDIAGIYLQVRATLFRSLE